MTSNGVDETAEIELGPNALMALDAIHMRPTRGIPEWIVHIMEVSEIEHFSGHEPGDYEQDPEGVYLDLQRRFGVGVLDQYLALNPLSMTDRGYAANTARRATTGADEIVLNDIRIDSAEAVVEHMARFVFPQLEAQIAEPATNPTTAAARFIENERKWQKKFGPEMLKVPYGIAGIPHFRYGQYGYENYFMAYKIYPEVMERDFALQATCAERHNTIAAAAFRLGNLPPATRLDCDIADGRGTIIDVRSLDRLWFPHLARAIQPLLDAGVRLLWHCDGNLRQVVPRLIEVGIGGFQGFQYEFEMDYEAICRMTDRNGGPLMIWGGVSVTTTLPLGTPNAVAREIDWLVEHAPPVGFVLGCSSSITPGVPRANLQALLDGLTHYRTHRRR